MKNASTLLAACAAVMLAASAHAQDAAARHVRSIAATCANCHGTEGRAVDATAVPGLAGLPSNYIVDQMKAFRSGTRTSTVMQQVAKGYNEAQVEQLAAYFAAQRK
jgi:sulfide dehydrogenase cytochrome subunit